VSTNYVKFGNAVDFIPNVMATVAMEAVISYSEIYAGFYRDRVQTFVGFFYDSGRRSGRNVVLASRSRDIFFASQASLLFCDQNKKVLSGFITCL